jgi:hypothetical protein
MSYQNDTTSELLVLSIGDGAGPEVFTPLCSFAAGSRGYEFLTNFAERKVADCVTPTNPMLTKRTAESQDWSVDADGTCNAGDDKTLADWAKSGLAKNIKVVNTVTGGLTVAGSAFLQSFRVIGPGKGQSVNVAIHLVANGVATHTATA